MGSEKTYICIDLKSFYASVECVERGLDPLITNLVVADPERTDKTICLAITPAMKALGIKNRCRVFEIPKNVSYIIAEPRMKLYLEYSAKIYSIYLKYISKDDIHVYSIDEVFMDVTDYLFLYKMTGSKLGERIMQDIFSETGIPASCGIGTNLYLTKVALDITAKHSPNFIGYLDEEGYKKTLWHHRPLTDFWRVGKGTANKLASVGIYTMYDIAHANEELLYHLFGVDAELLIDHAWGIEPVTIADIKSYNSRTNCLSSGQVLMRDYSFEEGKLIVKEMMDLLCLDMVEKNIVTSSVTLQVGYSNALHVEHSRGTVTLDTETNADIIIIPAITKLYERIVNPLYPVRRIYITVNNVIPEEYSQYSLFADGESLEKNRRHESSEKLHRHRAQQTDWRS